MNKNLVFRAITILNLVVLIGLILYQFVWKDQRIVYVDSAKLMNNYTGMIDARKAYQQKATAWKANVDTLTNEVKLQIMNYEKESGKMTANERKLSQELIRTKQNQLAQYQKAMNTQAQQEDAKMTGDVLNQVNAYIKKYGESHGYTIIMAATEYGNMAYADEKLDITDRILEGLNREYAGQ